MNIDIEDVKLAKEMLQIDKSDLNYSKPRKIILKALEQQQARIERLEKELETLHNCNRNQERKLDNIFKAYNGLEFAPKPPEMKE